MKSLIAQTLFIGLTFSTIACSGTKDEVAKQIEDVQREITSLRASNAVLKDRLDLIETSPKAKKVGSEAADEEGAGDRPALEVVHLSPEEDPKEPATIVAAPLDDSPPMVIVGDGDGVEEVGAEPSDPKAKTTQSRYPKTRYPKAQQPNARYPQTKKAGQ